MTYAIFQMLFVIWLICFMIVPGFLFAFTWCEHNLPEPVLVWFAWLRSWIMK